MNKLIHLKDALKQKKNKMLTAQLSAFCNCHKKASKCNLDSKLASLKDSLAKDNVKNMRYLKVSLVDTQKPIRTLPIYNPVFSYSVCFYHQNLIKLSINHSLYLLFLQNHLHSLFLNIC